MIKYDRQINDDNVYVDIPDEVENSGPSSNDNAKQKSASSNEITISPIDTWIIALAVVFILFYIAVGGVIARESGKSEGGGGFMMWTFALQFFCAALILLIVLLVSISRGNILEFTTPKRFMGFAIIVLMYSNLIFIPIISAFVLSLCCWFTYFEVRSDESMKIVTRFKTELGALMKDSVVEKVTAVAREIISKEKMKLQQEVHQKVEEQIRINMQSAMTGMHGGIPINRVE